MRSIVLYLIQSLFVASYHFIIPSSSLLAKMHYRKCINELFISYDFFHWDRVRLEVTQASTKSRLSLEQSLDISIEIVIACKRRRQNYELTLVWILPLDNFFLLSTISWWSFSLENDRLSSIRLFCCTLHSESIFCISQVFRYSRNALERDNCTTVVRKLLTMLIFA